MQKTTTLLMFEGNAEEAMELYVSLFPGSSVTNISRYDPEKPGMKGLVKFALFNLKGTDYRCIDSPIKHNFTFTPSISIFVECETEAELDQLYDALSSGGQVLMPSGNYAFSQKFAWLADRFGVSWQLNYLSLG